MEKFVTRCAAHPQLLASARFITFLQADDHALAQAKVDCKNDKKKTIPATLAWLESLTLGPKVNGC